MSTPKVGDRVRVVIEGRVSAVHSDGFTYFIDDGWAARVEVGERGVVSIEVIAPPVVLPTKRWAQVVEQETLWTRRYLDEDSFDDSDAQWFSDDYLESSSERLAGRPGLRVISEGVDDE